MHTLGSSDFHHHSLHAKTTPPASSWMTHISRQQRPILHRGWIVKPALMLRNLRPSPWVKTLQQRLQAMGGMWDVSQSTWVSQHKELLVRTEYMQITPCCYLKRVSVVPVTSPACYTVKLILSSNEPTLCFTKYLGLMGTILLNCLIIFHL